MEELFAEAVPGNTTERQCAQEDEGCPCTGHVKYGGGDRWSAWRPAAASGWTPCNSRVFGDPWHGVRKACVCRVSAVQYAPASSGWVAAPLRDAPPRLLVPRAGVVAVVFAEKLWAIGGHTSHPTSRVEVFNGVRWSVAPSLLAARHYTAAAVFRGRIYCVGGLGVRGVLSSVEAYDGARWTPAPSLAVPRYCLAVAAFGGRLWAVGGTSDGSALSSVEVFDGQSWSAGPSMSTARLGHAVAVFEHRLFAIAGKNRAEGVLSSVETLELSTDEGNSSWLAAPPLQIARSDAPAAVFAGRLYVLGGQGAGGALSSVEEVRTGAKNVSRCPPGADPITSTTECEVAVADLYPGQNASASLDSGRGCLRGDAALAPGGGD